MSIRSQITLAAAIVAAATGLNVWYLAAGPGDPGLRAWAGGASTAVVSLVTGYLLRRGRARTADQTGPEDTASRDAERVVRERAQLLSSMNANLPGTIVYRAIYHPDGRMECPYVSPNIEGLVGYAANAFEADATTVFRLLHPEDLPRFKQEMARAVATGSRSSFVTRLRHGRGGDLWVQIRSQLAERRTDGAQVRDGVVVDVTAAKQAEADLQAVRQRLELALRASRTCTWESDAGSAKLTLDPAWAVIRGFPPVTTVTTWRRLVATAHPQDRPAISHEVRRVMRGETDDYQVEHRVSTASSDWIWVRSHGRVLERDAGGVPQRIVGTNVDITAHRLAEDGIRELNANLERLVLERTAELATSTAQLAKSEKLYRNLVENINQGYFVCDRRSQVTYCNPAAAAAIGLTAAQMVGKSAFRQIAAEDRARVIAAFDDAVRNGATALTLDFRIPIQSGRVIWAEQRTTIVRDTSGAVVELHNTVFDITERRAAEELLRQSNERFFAVFERSPIMIGLLSVPDGKLVEFNAAGVRAFGYTREEAVGRTSVELNLWADEADRARYLRELQAKGHVTGFEALMRRKNGETFPVIYNGSLIEISGRMYSLNSLQDVSERRRAERALRESEERLAFALAATSDGLWDWNIATGDVHFSDQWARLLGYEPGEVPARVEFFYTVLHPADVARVQHALDDHFAGRATVKEDEVRLRMKSGEYRWFLDRGKIVARDGAGQPTRMVGTITDITERNRTKLRMTAFAKLGRQLNAISRDQDAAAKIVAVADELFGWDMATLDVYDAARDRFRSIFNADIVDGRRRPVAPLYSECAPTPRMRRVLENGAELILRTAPVRADSGDVLAGDVNRPSASIMIVPLREGVRVVGLLSVQSYRLQAYTAADLDALQAMADHCAGALVRIETINALGASEERFRLVWENSTDGMKLSDADGRIVAVNAAYCRIMGKRREEMEGQLVSVSYAADDGATILARYREHFAQRLVPTQRERVATLWDGRTVLLETVDCFIESAQARPLVLSVFRDITDRRREENERAKMQTRLFQNQKFEALGTLAGGVAHDFNNILAGMLNYTTLARDDCPPSHPEIREYLGEVLTGARRAKDLVRQILLLSRSEGAERSPVQIALVVREALSLLRSTSPASIEITSDIDQQAPPVLANATQIHQVIMNLGINAVHAMRARGGTLFVALHRRELDAALAAELGDLRPGPHVRIEVRDNGCGMEPAVAARIFEPFFTTKDVGEGTGLGLAVVRSVVRSHGGAIAVHTQPDAGATFELYLPATAAAAGDTPAATDEIPAGRAQRILVVDDEYMITRSVQLTLQRLGYRVTTFNQPIQALERFAAAPGEFDLVITDFQMPGMNGLDLAAKLLAIRPDTGIFISSGFSGSVTDDQVRELGLLGLLRKPIEVAELAATLARYFAGRAP